MRIAAFDIETTDLKGLMGTLLCGSFQEIVPPGYYGNHHDTPPRPYSYSLHRVNPYDPNPDRVLATVLRDEIETYNMIVTWNGKMFDIPFLDARLAFFGERPVRVQFHLDVMYQARGVGLRIGSSKLANVQRYFQLDETKTEVDWDIWKAAGLGDPAAMKEVIKHCEADVRVLSQVYWRLLPKVANIHR